jgi:hypothetical protein
VRTPLLFLAIVAPLTACGRSGPHAGAPPATSSAAGSPGLDVPPTPSVSAAPTMPPAPASGAVPGLRCARDVSFPSPWDLPEASAAAEVELRPGLREILVVSDSGRRGAAMAWSKAGGTRAIVLPLDALASDDLEGMAWLASGGSGQLYTLTSSGAVRSFVPDGAGGLSRYGGTYPIGAPPLSCDDLRAINCNKNWEGLCLRRRDPRARCAGYAASKSETALYCVVRNDLGGLAIDPSRPPLQLDLDRLSRRHGVLSDCAFGAAGGPAEDVLLVTTNLFGGSQTYVVDETTGTATPLDVQATASNEAIAVDRAGALYAFLDDNGVTSVATRFTCLGWR